MTNLIYIFYLLLLFALSWGYFKIARKYEIVDLPNHRTMHSDATIRGGGIVIFVGVLVHSLFLKEPSYYFAMGLCLIGITGFLDDLIDLSSKIRLVFQVLSMLFIVAELSMWSHNIFIIGLVVLIGVGVLNAYNFMDGINGITGGYSFVTILTLAYVNNYIHVFVPNEFLFFMLISLLVFNFFNFRKRAVCFAGDVGSLSIAFIVIYLITKLVDATNQLVYILFLTLYGIDTIFTLIQRLALKENIFEAHRLHLFQVGISKTGGSHLYMSLIYIVVQIIINIIVIITIPMTILDQMLYLGILLSILSLVYIRLKRKLMPEIL